MTTSELDMLCSSARLHADNVRADINNASTRIEHIRLTTLALEAENIAHSLESIRDGAHNANTTRIDT